MAAERTTTVSLVRDWLNYLRVSKALNAEDHRDVPKAVHVVRG
jgi:hypothetical protein